MKLIKSIGRYVRSFVLSALLLSGTSIMSYAQSAGGGLIGDNLGEAVIEEATGALSDLVDSIVTLLQVVMGLGAIIVLAIVIFKVFKGDREAAEKLAWWVAGLTLGFVLLSVVSGLIPNA